MNGDDTKKNHRAQIAELAKQAFAKHTLEQLGPKRWRCWNGTGFYAFRIYELPDTVLLRGDIGTFVIDANGDYDLDWLENAIKSPDYVLEKCSLERKTCYLRDEFRRWVLERCNKEERRWAEDYNYDELAWHKVSLNYYERTGNSEIPQPYDFDSRAFWCLAAFERFFALRAEVSA